MLSSLFLGNKTRSRFTNQITYLLCNSHVIDTQTSPHVLASNSASQMHGLISKLFTNKMLTSQNKVSTI